MDPQLAEELARIQSQIDLTNLMIRKATAAEDSVRVRNLQLELKEQEADYAFCLRLSSRNLSSSSPAPTLTPEPTQPEPMSRSRRNSIDQVSSHLVSRCMHVADRLDLFLRGYCAGS